MLTGAAARDRRRASLRLRSLADGHVVLAGDFHVHAFPGDGALTPRRLRDLAADQGLDVIAITTHNQTLASRLLPADGDPIVLLGEEVTNLVRVDRRMVCPLAASVRPSCRGVR
jgi:hypothetical protein